MAEQAEFAWHYVHEEMPTKGEGHGEFNHRFIVCTKTGTVTVASVYWDYNKDMEREYYFKNKDIIAWTVLPLPKLVNDDAVKAMARIATLQEEMKRLRQQLKEMKDADVFEKGQSEDDEQSRRETGCRETEIDACPPADHIRYSEGEGVRQ